ncbi:MAG: hypothetical protein LBP95_11610, partial [Deltaproteobacteria bacterium]|nr:hypothetical protein [Deltaproteobacteria bacterium]
EYSDDLFKNPANIIKQNSRDIFCKQIKISIDGYDYFAYLCIDNDKYANDYKKGCQELPYDESNNIDIKVYNDKMKRYGRFILLSNTNIDPKDIISKYYIRQRLGQIFDIAKTEASLLPLRCHSDETLRGHILLNFIATVIHLLINNKVKNTTLNFYSIFETMYSLYINIYDTVSIIETPTSKENDIIEALELKTEYSINKRAVKNQKLQDLSAPRRRGRPRGSNKKVVKYKEIETTAPKTEFLPKGFVKNIDTDEFSHVSGSPRGRGRPKGSTNRLKVSEKGDSGPSFSGEEAMPSRWRGHPKGSTNRPKVPEGGN